MFGVLEKGKCVSKRWEGEGEEGEREREREVARGRRPSAEQQAAIGGAGGRRRE